MEGLNASHIIEGSVTLIILFWIFKNAQNFAIVTGAVADVIGGSARALWGGGRPNAGR